MTQRLITGAQIDQTTLTGVSVSNLNGGTAGSLPYQTGPNTTAMLPPQTPNSVLVSGTAPSWSSSPSLLGLNVAGFPVWTTGTLTNLNQLTNGPGYITTVTSSQITGALGYVPYNAANPAGYITTSSNITGNAASASKLTPGRNINGTLFDGTTDITITASDPTKLPLAGGTITGNLSINGIIPSMGGFSPANGVVRLSSNLYLNSIAGAAVIVNWDNGGSGTQLAFRVGNGAAGEVFSVSHAGTVIALGDIGAFSDIRIKKNIEVIPDALKKVVAIRGVTFQRSDSEDTRRHTGVIAQEVEKVLPEVVGENIDGMKTVSYGNMVGLLIEAIKELKAEFDQRISALESK